MTTPQDYASAGVDVTKGEQAVERIKKHVKITFTPDVLKGVGAFAGALSATKLKSCADPVLFFSVDGVGTKTVVAELANKWDGIGVDIVHHCANDILCQGGAPLTFLDYIASSSLDPSIVEIIIEGMSKACKDLDCVLIGGEMAEMPQVYHDGAHDVVGSMIGYGSKEKMFDTETIAEGDVLIALPSNGLHTNGYSLARKVLGDDLEKHADALLQPHTCYVKTVLKLHKEIGLKGIAHITGGGIPGNLKRILPKGLGANIDKSSIKSVPIFELIQKTGNIADEAMFEAFNMGVGMMLVCAPEKKDAVLENAKEGYVIGEVTNEDGVLIR